MSIRMRLREERAQATVEMAVVAPILLVLALIVYNVMIFASAVARFDRRCLRDRSDANSECHGRLRLADRSVERARRGGIGWWPVLPIRYV